MKLTQSKSKTMCLNAREILSKEKSSEVTLSRGIIILDTARQKYPKRNLAVVFDIDDTALLIDKKNMNNAKVMPTFRKLYECALALNYEVFFVTARPDNPSNRKWTVGQLKRYNFSRYKKLYMMPESYYRNHKNFSYYKYTKRKSIAKKYLIVLNVGDQWADIALLSNYRKNGQHTFIDVCNNTYSLDSWFFLLNTRKLDVSLYAIKLPSK